MTAHMFWDPDTDVCQQMYAHASSRRDTYIMMS